MLWNTKTTDDIPTKYNIMIIKTCLQSILNNVGNDLYFYWCNAWMKPKTGHTLSEKENRIDERSCSCTSWHQKYLLKKQKTLTRLNKTDLGEEFLVNM